jgi:hypothetical protein
MDYRYQQVPGGRDATGTLDPSLVAATRSAGNGQRDRPAGTVRSQMPQINVNGVGGGVPFLIMHFNDIVSTLRDWF